MLITGQTGFRTGLLKLGLLGAAIAPSSHLPCSSKKQD